MLATLEESLSPVPHFAVINSCQLAMFYLTFNRGARLTVSPAAHLVSCRGKERRARAYPFFPSIVTCPDASLSLCCIKWHSTGTAQPFFCSFCNKLSLFSDSALNLTDGVGS